jgi:hypothetical protein
MPNEQQRASGPYPRDIEAQGTFLSTERAGRISGKTGCRPRFFYDGQNWAAIRVGVLELVLTISVMLVPAFAQPAAPSSVPGYKPITERERLKWFVASTVGPTSLLGAGPLSAGLGTAFNNPPEYGPHWEGFGKRYGIRLTGVSTGNAIEATLGAAWGEDPRYFPSPNRGFGARVKYIIKTTFLAPRRDGRWNLAYARYAGNVGNNFLSNLWRVDSDNDLGDTARRCVWGITGRIGGNAFVEFWPDVKKIMFKKKPASLQSAGGEQQ